MTVRGWVEFDSQRVTGPGERDHGLVHGSAGDCGGLLRCHCPGDDLLRAESEIPEFAQRDETADGQSG